jgi:hypothetical protein
MANDWHTKINRDYAAQLSEKRNFLIVTTYYLAFDSFESLFFLLENLSIAFAVMLSTGRLIVGSN